MRVEFPDKQLVCAPIDCRPEDGDRSISWKGDISRIDFFLSLPSLMGPSMSTGRNMMQCNMHNESMQDIRNTLR